MSARDLLPAASVGLAATAGARRPQRTARVALLDAHDVRLQRMAAWLPAAAPQFEVVLAATTWVRLIRDPAFPTDFVLMDVQPGEPVSLDARIRTCRAAGAAVVVLPGPDYMELREQAVRAGAAAFLDPSRSLDDVLSVAREALGLAPGAPGGGGRHPQSRAAAEVERPRLSLGEEAALRLYASGRTTDQVAGELHVRFETAKTYLRRVRQKYARAGRPAGRRATLVERAREDGYI